MLSPRGDEAENRALTQSTTLSWLCSTATPPPAQTFDTELSPWPSKPATVSPYGFP